MSPTSAQSGRPAYDSAPSARDFRPPRRRFRRRRVPAARNRAAHARAARLHQGRADARARRRLRHGRRPARLARAFRGCAGVRRRYLVGDARARELAEAPTPSRRRAGGGSFPPRSARRSARAARNFAQADFSALPFAAGAFEFIWSNLALHWHSRPDLVFPEWQRVLKVNGLLMFSTLGPDTLQGTERRVSPRSEAAHGVAPQAT